jgi:Cd2+/Zn2+-exporting ATPase
VVFDKTGTITNGEFTISEVIPVSCERERVLSLAMTAEYSSNHPLAKSIMNSDSSYGIPDESREIAGEGVIATLRGQSIAVGNKALMARVGVSLDGIDAPVSSFFVALDTSLAGILVISDKIKDEARASVSALASLGVKNTVILSGDRKENVEYVRAELGINESYAELTPEGEYAKLEEIIPCSRSTIYVGDGINDAPALARADVGLSMGKMGQDSAIEASDVVIMSDNLTKIPESIRIARKTLGIAKQNIVFALSVKVAILIFGALGFANMWLAVFADVGVAVLAILNSMRALGKR